MPKRTVDPKKLANEKKKYLRALEKNGGHIANAAKAIGYTRQTIQNWRKADAEFDEAIIDVHETSLDDIQESMYQRAKGKKVIDEDTGEVKYEGGSDLLSIFIMKTQGAKRGFIEKQQLEVNAGGKTLMFIPSDVEDVEALPVEPMQLEENNSDQTQPDEN